MKAWGGKLGGDEVGERSYGGAERVRELWGIEVGESDVGGGAEAP